MTPLLLTDVVRADLERLQLPHQQPHLLRLLVLKQLHLPHAALLPLVAVLIKAVQLRLAVRTTKNARFNAEKCMSIVQVPGSNDNREVSLPALVSEDRRKNT